MRDATEEFFKQWLIKAQEDWDTVQILTTQENFPKGAVCFHCQQCIEKLIKAVLVKHRVEFPKTHDIDRLVRLVRDWVPGLAKLLPFAQKLTIHGVDTRYPDEVRVVDDIEMKQVVEITEKFRDVILKKI